MTGGIPLLTHGAQQSALFAALDDKFVHRGELFIPDANWYNQLDGTAGLTTATKDIYRWLGIKPRRLRVYFSEQPAIKSGDIVIDPSYEEFPYLLGGLLAFAVLRELCATYKLPTEAPLIELASLETGLGLLVLNGSAHHDGHLMFVHHALNGIWHRHNHTLLTSYTTSSYVDGLLAYTHEHQLSPRAWGPCLSPAARQMIPGISRYHLPADWPIAEMRHRRAARRRWVTAGLSASATAGVLALGLFVWAQRPYQPSAQAVEAYQDIHVLEQAYQACTSKARQQINQPLTDDIFHDRQVNATLVRCQSLRNQYNYRVDQYNRIVQD